MRYKQSSWDAVALQGQFAARIREFCNSSMTVKACGCGDSSGTHRKLSKTIVPSSMFIACTVKILYPLLLTNLFPWDYNHSSSELKNKQAVRSTLGGQTQRLTWGRAAYKWIRLLRWGCEQHGELPSLGSCPSPRPEGLQLCLCLAIGLPDPNLRSWPHHDLPHCRDLRNVAGPGSCHWANLPTSPGARHSTAEG